MEYDDRRQGKLYLIKTDGGLLVRRKIWFALAVLGCTGMIALIWLLDIPSWKQLDMEKLWNLSQTTIIYDDSAVPVSGMNGGENRMSISIDSVPEYVKNAFIAIEDARFYEHCGVDLWRIGGAIINNLKAGGYAEGASTITQQLIKLTHLTSDKKLSRKAQEAWLAIQLEQIAEKDQILEMYLNTVYFGKGAYGIEAAAQVYFGKSAQELNISEGALLAGVIKAPGNYAPHISMEKALERRNLVLEAMKNEGMITEDEAESAKQEEIRLTDSKMLGSSGNWYVDWALREAGDCLGISIEEVLSGGYRIYTALDSEMQSVSKELYQEESYFPGNAADGTRPESAMISIEPDNGEIVCMIGGRSYDVRMGFNRATQLERQPGSAFKPISVYAAAVDLLGFTPISMIEDVAREYDGYQPSNSSGKEYGNVSLRQALVRSMNLAAIDLITKTGVDQAALYAKRAGIPLTESDLNLSLALGSLTDGVSPAQMSAAYAPLTNGGHSVEPHTIRLIEDLYGKVLYEYSHQDSYVMSEKSARMITDMLEDTAAYGTAKAIGEIGYPAAAKTGTVGSVGGGNRDAWTVAYTPNIVVTVWMGFDQPDEMHQLPEGTTGGSYPARLAAAFLNKTKEQNNGGSFQTPEGMSSVLIDKKALELYGIPMLASEETPSKYLQEELLPDEQIPIMKSDLWNAPVGVEHVYTQTTAEGFPVISFIATDAYAEYRIIRKEGGKQTEVGSITGSPGEYLSFTDESANGQTGLEYCVVARHRLLMEEGILSESKPSEWSAYSAPGILERLLADNDQGLEEEALPIIPAETKNSSDID